MSTITAIILAAGFGTRMRSNKPKVLHPLLGVPMLSYIIQAVKTQTDEILVVVGKDADEVRQQFPDCNFVVQEQPKGTGDAVRCAMDSVKTERVMILNGDVPLLTPASLASLNLSRGPAMLTASVSDPTGFGRIIRQNGEVKAIRECKDASIAEKAINEVNTGIYAFDTEPLKIALSQLTPNNKQAEYYLTDVIEHLARTSAVHTHKIPAAENSGVNTQQERALVEQKLHERKLINYMLDGLSIQGPGNVWIEGCLTFGKDVVLEPGVVIKGVVELGDGVRVGAYSVLQDTVIKANTVIKPYSHIEGAVVDHDATVGPYARLRPGANLSSGVSIGNFVEVKNSVLEPNVKVNHLSYIGDANIGSGANIGAGTVTCNYDGINKHKTSIGANAFIGSGTMLVAPVNIGKGATVGAGSTITKDVTESALAVARAKQSVIENWTAPSMREKEAK